MNILRCILAAFITLLAIGAYGCSDSDTVGPPGDDGSVIKTDTLSGNIKGTMQAGKTYYLAADAFVQKGDTLRIEKGARLVALGPGATGVYTLFIRGTLLAEGTRDSMIVMEPLQRYSGAWGGLQCDSPNVVSLKFTQIDLAGGLRPDGRPRPAIYILSSGVDCEFILEDCILSKPKDDGFTIYGGHGRIMRNYFPWNGEVDGSGPNFKSGFRGKVAYNYIWSCVDQCIRVETSSAVLFPQTDVEIYNNTIINSGHKNPARPGAAILIDKFARAKVYNNIIVNCLRGLHITPLADTANTVYGNNLFYTTIDSLRQNFYPPRPIGVAQPVASDLVQVDPMFVTYDANTNAATDQNDVHLRLGSPAIGAGNPSYDEDLGCWGRRRNN